MMRRHARSALEVLAVTLGLPALGRKLNAGKRLVLAYHNVLPDEVEPAGDSSLHLSRARFVEQMEVLATSHQIVPLQRVLEDVTGGPNRPLAAITFDDAYRGALQVAVPELVQRGLPATIFVAPGLLGSDAFWWDLLAESARRAVRGDLRYFALADLDGKTTRILEWAEQKRHEGREVNEWMRPATLGELQELSGETLITLGSHTWSHPNLARLPSDERLEELSRPLGWLRKRFPDRVVPWIAYPYGLTSRDTIAAARQVGYDAGLMIDGGLLAPARDDRFALPRLNVPSGVSRRGFQLRSAGIWPR